MTASADEAKKICGGEPGRGRVLQWMTIDLLKCEQGLVHHHGDLGSRIVDQCEGRHRAGRHAEQLCETLELAEAEAAEPEALGHHFQVDARVLLATTRTGRPSNSRYGHRAGCHAKPATVRR